MGSGDSLREPTAAAPLGGYLGGDWPGRDHSSMKDRRPPFVSWDQAARSDKRLGGSRSPRGFGVPLNPPRFLEWVGVPDSARLLEMSPGQWLDSLSRDKAMSAAIQLHRDACLMNTNLNILDQYAMSLHGAASKILEKTIGGDPYPGAAAGAKGPRARRASVQMEAMGLWRPSLDPVQLETMD